MNKLIPVLLVASLAGCQRSSQTWSWNGLSLGMSSKNAAPVVQKLCGSDKPLERREFPKAQTWIIGCDVSQAELAGQRVGIDVQFYQDKLIVVSLKPPADAPEQWWQTLQADLDKKYGPGTADPRGVEHTWEWKTKSGEWIRTNGHRSIAFAALEPMLRRSAAASKLQAVENGKRDPSEE